MPRSFLASTFSFSLLLVGTTVWAAPIPVRAVQKQSNGVTLSMAQGTLRLQVCTPRILHVTYSPTAVFPTPCVPVVNARFALTPFQLTPTTQSVTLATSLMNAQVDRRTGTVRFLDAQGRAFLSETPNGRSLTPITLDGPTPESAYQSSQSFALPADEGIYGLGQHQDGLMDYRGSSVTLE